MMNEVTFCCSRFSHVAKFLILLNNILFYFFFSSISFCIFTLSNISICIVSYSSECFIDFLSRFFSPFFSFFFFLATSRHFESRLFRARRWLGCQYYVRTYYKPLSLSILIFSLLFSRIGAIHAHLSRPIT